MIMTRMRIAIASIAAAAVIVSVTAQSQWYALYDEAIKHVQAGEFQEAEAKLVQAKKDGPASGRNVLRYGSLRAPYFPDYYLGIVYNATNRPKEALDAFAAARAANIDAKNNEFKLIATFEAQARTNLANASNNIGKPPVTNVPAVDPNAERQKYVTQFDQLLNSGRAQLAKRDFDGAERSGTNAKNMSDERGLGFGQRADAFLKDVAGSRQLALVEEALNKKDANAASQALGVLSAIAPTLADNNLRNRVAALVKESTPVVPIAPNNNNAANVAAAAAQFDNLLNNARNQLGQRNFDAADEAANTARRLAIQRLDPSYEQRADAVSRDVLTGRHVTRIEAAIKARDVAAARRELSALGADSPKFDARPLTTQVDRIDNEIAATTLQRNAMRAFFSGNYQESLTALGQIERTGQVNARTQFYRACSLAALAATSTNPGQDKRLADAKKFYAEAAKTPDQFRDDLRYISPKVRQLLGI